MLKEEATWVKNGLGRYFEDTGFPLLNVGSSTFEFRNQTQPFIQNEIFTPIQQQNKKVIHTDIKNMNGVDLVGDLNEAHFRSKLKYKGIKSILCSNLLEHLERPKLICTSILDILPVNGKLIITVPYFFPNTELIEGAIVKSSDLYLKDLFSNKKYLFIMLIRWLLPIFKFNEWRHVVSDLLLSRKSTVLVVWC